MARTPECPWVCERCGSNQWKVPESRWSDIGKKRWRVCAMCKQRMDGCTVEVVVPKGFVVQLAPESKEEVDG